MEKKITVIKGDGIGPEIVTEAQKVLDKILLPFLSVCKFRYNQFYYTYEKWK